ncbi:Neuroblastoma-amplified sequence [Nymphon striatum]|nr:Neuroblastoma-amplified sequence [Nymphon striatum]
MDEDITGSETLENILYECLVYCEWPQEPELLLIEVNKSSLVFPFSIVIKKSGKLLAVLLNHCIEIRSIKDEFASVIGKAKIDKDPYLQWRVLKWSPDGKILVYVNSFGSINMFDASGTSLFSLNSVDMMNPRLSTPNTLNTVASLLFIEDSNSKLSCRDEVLVIYHNGTLQSFYIKSLEEFDLGHTFNFTNYYTQGITAATYHHSQPLLLISGPSQDSNQNRISSWKFPYFTFNKKPSKELATFLSISPNGKNAVSLHANGAVALWDFPSLRYRKTWLLEQQPNYDNVNPNKSSGINNKNTNVNDLQNHPVDLNWWSDQEIVMARLSGAVIVSHINSFKNLLGNSAEWFEPSPQLSAATNGCFYVLECENQVSKKRRLVSDVSSDESNLDEEYSSEEEEDVSIIKKSKQTIKSVLFYVTDSERFQPPRKKPKIMTKTYRLLCLKSTTPEELYAHKIDCEEYGEALSLARDYGLDCDLVYQRQWRKSVASVSSIQDYLSKITKRSWVLHECLERVPENVDAAKELLQYGLCGTDVPTLIAIGKGEDHGKFIICDRHTLYEEEALTSEYIDPEEILRQRREKEQNAVRELMKQVDFKILTLEQKQLINYRKRLLMYLDKLSTYEVILGGAHAAEEHFDCRFYKEFRMKSPLRCSIDFARQSNWRAIEALFTYHGRETLPCRLTILSNFPETTSPFEYQSLLPECESDNQVSLWCTENWRIDDWSEDSSLCTSSDVKANGQDGEFDDVIFYDTELERAFEFVTCIENYLTSSDLTKWYQRRAYDIETNSFQIDNALELIKLGLERNIPNLEILYDDLVTMETLVYECLAGPEVLFTEFCKMSEIEKLKLLMSFVSEHLKRTSSRILKDGPCHFFNNIKNMAETFLQLLNDYLSYLAAVDLTPCWKIFEASLQDGEMTIILGRECLLNAAINCIFVYASAAEILESNEIPLTIQQIDEISNNRDKGVELLKKFARKATRNNMTQGELWRQVLYDVLEIRSKIFHGSTIAEDECFQIFTESLLCSGNKANINLAGNLINTSQSKTKPPIMSKLNNPLYYKRVDYQDGINLIISAAQEYFNSASDLLDSCMELSRSCLQLIEDREESIQEELDLISSLGILNNFNVHVLPVQVRVCKDRLDLIKMAIESYPNTYKSSQQLLKLAHFLRINAHEVKICEGKVLHLLADAAFEVEDFEFCKKYCSSIMKLGYDEGWIICEKLSLCEEFHDLLARCELISYSLCYCPIERIKYLLDMKGLLEVEILSNKMKEDVNGSKSFEVIEPSLSSQMKQVYQVTSSTSKVILNKLPGQDFWKNATKWIGFTNNGSDSSDTKDKSIDNSEIIQQGVAEFFASSFTNCFCSQIDADFSGYSVNYENFAFSCAQSLLRLSLLDNTLSEGEINNLNPEVILAVTKHVMQNDVTSGIGLLLSLSQPLDAESYLSKLSKSDVTLQLITYYYALQLYSLLWTADSEIPLNVYKADPSQLISFVKRLVCSQQLKLELHQTCINNFLEYYDCLADFLQGQALKKFNFGVDIPRFASDLNYKQETILGLSMTTSDEVYEIALSLAHRYNVSLWKFYCAHLVFLFLEQSSITKEELENKVNDSMMLEILLENKPLFKEKLLTEVAPSISGEDLPKLLLMYSLLEKCDDQEVHDQKPSQHIKSIKKFMNIMPEMNYRELTEDTVPVLDVIYPHLHKDNLAAVIKLAPKIPNKAGSYLDSSSIYCLWSQKLFYKENERSLKQSKSDDAWYQRFYNCKDFTSKLKPNDYLTFMNQIIFVDRALDEMSTVCRGEILKRSLKFVSQQLSKATDDILHEKWQEVMDNLRWNITHLGFMQNEPIKSFTQSSDPILKGYARNFDISRSQEKELKDFLMKTVIDGQPSSVFEDLLSMCQSIGFSWTSTYIYEETILSILNVLRKNSTNLLGSYETNALSSLQYVLEHMNKLDTDIDIVSILRTFYSDENVIVKIRLSVLQLLEELYSLDEEGKISKLLLQTIFHLKVSWPNTQITTSDVACEESRLKLFKGLLKDSDKISNLTTLCQILCSWPSLHQKSMMDQNENLWFLVLLKMIKLGTKASLDQALGYLTKYHETTIPSQMMNDFVDEIANQNSPYHFIKMCLLSNDKSIHANAIEEANRLSQVKEDDYDEQILNLILKQDLLQEFIGTVLFEPCVEFLLDSQSAHIDAHLSVEKVISALLSKGYEVEAGALFLRYNGTHQSLVNYNSALCAVKRLIRK